MANGNDVVLWRAPSPECADPAREIGEGFEPERYPGDGPYFATYKQVAEEFQRCYGNGMQEIHLPQMLFDTMIEQGFLKPDGYYPPGQSWHVTADDLPAFNAAIKHGEPNRYYPEGS